MLSLFSFFPDRWTKWLVQAAALVRNPFVVGVRIIVQDESERILLVRHSYLNGWYLPGGGVERGESLHQAASREVLEEAGVRAIDLPLLVGMYLNLDGIGRDHIGLFRLEAWRQAETYLQPSVEIAEAAFFELDALPTNTSPATMRRIAELKAGVFPTGAKW